MYAVRNERITQTIHFQGLENGSLVSILRENLRWISNRESHRQLKGLSERERGGNLVGWLVGWLVCNVNDRTFASGFGIVKKKKRKEKKERQR